jgi:hypothetical protein
LLAVTIDLYVHIFFALLLVVALVMLAYVVRVEREVAAELKHRIDAYGAGNLRQDLKGEELIERVRNEMHADWA